MNKATTRLQVNRERLAHTFTELCQIASPSHREGQLARHLRRVFTDLGADSIHEDDSAQATGSECGNLIVTFNGTAPAKEPLFISCHMDTVEPAENIKVVRDSDIFTSRGATVLGGDDKTGIAACIEVISLLRENKASFGRIELVLTTCEEVGLLGAKALDSSKITAQHGYALDSTGIDKLIIGAPAANKLMFIVHGVAAHAGLNPEAGVSAIVIVAQALSTVQLGRIDAETTANVGLIQGGVATNIVPDKVIIEGEVRSHSQAKLQHYTEHLVSAFQQAVEEWQQQTAPELTPPSLESRVFEEYPLLHLDDNSPVIQRVRDAAAILDRDIDYISAGGGSDANILNSLGLPTGILATGMNKVHTTDEYADLNDLVSVTELLYTMITL